MKARIRRRPQQILDCRVAEDHRGAKKVSTLHGGSTAAIGAFGIQGQEAFCSRDVGVEPLP